MEQKPEIEVLIPQYPLEEIISYKISKEEIFRFKTAYSKPFNRSYTIEIRKLEGEIYEIYYPKGLLSAFKYFEYVDEYLDQLIHAQNSSLYISITEEDELEMLNFETLQKHLHKLKKDLLSRVPDKTKHIKIEDTFENLSSKEDISKYLMEDLRYLFDFHGLAKEDGVYLDFTQEKTKLEKFASSLFSTIGIGPEFSSIDLLMFDYVGDGKYKIEGLSGIDTISTTDRHDFQFIQDSFLAGDFDFEAYQDITLHYKRYIFDPKNLLESYHYKWKTNTADMLKYKEITVEKI